MASLTRRSDIPETLSSQDFKSTGVSGQYVNRNDPNMVISRRSYLSLQHQEQRYGDWQERRFRSLDTLEAFRKRLPDDSNLWVIARGKSGKYKIDDGWLTLNANTFNDSLDLEEIEEAESQRFDTVVMYALRWQL